jgi:hypothetical protein
LSPIRQDDLVFRHNATLHDLIGIFRSTTASFMAFAQGRVLSLLIRDLLAKT